MDGGIAGSQAAPDVGPRQQMMVLRVLGRLYGIARVVTRRLGVLPSLHLFLQAGVRHQALQKPGACHQDGIGFLFAQGVSLGSLSVGIFQVAATELEPAAIFQHAADTMMMVVMAVDLLRLLQGGRSAAAVPLVLAAITMASARRSAPVFIFILVPLLALAAALGLHIHLPADLQRDQALHI